jgi:hypothetical protein
MVGLGWLALNCATYVVLGLYKRHHYTRLKQTGHGIGFIENCLTVPLIIALCVATGEFKLSGVTAATIPGVAPHTATPFHAFTELQLATKLAVACTSLFAASMNIVYVNLFRLLPATAITVLGNLNKTVSIVLAAFLFNTRIPFTQKLSLATVSAAAQSKAASLLVCYLLSLTSLTIYPCIFLPSSFACILCTGHDCGSSIWHAPQNCERAAPRRCPESTHATAAHRYMGWWG